MLFLPALFLFFLGISAVSCNSDEDITDPSALLSEQEKATLRFMREEEKLAHDVYTHLGGLYDLQIFDNISASEQKHVDFVLDLMADYGLEDTGTDEPGIFTIPELQQLYETLIAQGEQSLLDALIVGATIEDVDIRDLQEAIFETEKADLISLYELLQCGSRNHLRGFTNHIEQQGGAYTPQYISQELFEEIINGVHESCHR